MTIGASDYLAPSRSMTLYWHPSELSAFRLNMRPGHHGSAPARRQSYGWDCPLTKCPHIRATVGWRRSPLPAEKPLTKHMRRQSQRVLRMKARQACDPTSDPIITARMFATWMAIRFTLSAVKKKRLKRQVQTDALPCPECWPTLDLDRKNLVCP